MKKKIALLLTVVLLIVSFSGCSIIPAMSEPELKIEVMDSYAVVKEFPTESSVVEITIPDEYEGVPVTEVADFACVNHDSIKTIIIGKNVEKIGVWAFENNQKLEKFVVSEENKNFCSVDGVLFSKDMKTLLFYPLAKDVTVSKDENGNQVKTSQYAVPDGVETIRTKAFYKCSVLTEITLPDSVKSIEEKVFFRCGNIKEIVLPKNIENIGQDCFAYCSGLKEMTIPASIKSIDKYAFFNCTSLHTLNIDAKESDLVLGEKWYPTNNGLDIKELVINWSQS